MFEYQEAGRFFAQIADGLEALAAEELAELGAERVTPIFRGAHFTADNATLCRVNYCSRLVSKVLAPLLSFPCHSTEQLYAKAQTIDWTRLFRVEQTFAVFSNVSNSTITHSKYAALCMKDAIVDQFRDKKGKRPDVNADEPDVWFHLFVHRNRATISLETSGGALHRRGYRKATREAPLNEIVAAAIIRMTEWDGDRPLYDPMCGSGTLLCEALMRYCRIPSGYFRKRFGFEFLPDYDARIWHSVKKKADDQIRELPEGLIAGSDASLKAVEVAGANVRNLPGGTRVKLKVTAFEKIAAIDNSAIVTNPPAGIRIGAKEGIDVFMKSFGDFLKQRCRGSVAYVYFTDRSLVKKIGLHTTWKKPIASGGIEGRLVKIELY